MILTHGHARRGEQSPEYSAWLAIKQRTLNPNNKRFKDYGGRGITITPEWRDNFHKFFSEVGPRPGTEYSIDRIDNSKGYEPGNVRWATRSQQQRNQRPLALCRKGLHLLTPENTRYQKGGYRLCKECSRARQRKADRAYAEKRRAA